MQPGAAEKRRSGPHMNGTQVPGMETVRATPFPHALDLCPTPNYPSLSAMSVKGVGLPVGEYGGSTHSTKDISYNAGRAGRRNEDARSGSWKIMVNLNQILLDGRTLPRGKGGNVLRP